IVPASFLACDGNNPLHFASNRTGEVATNMLRQGGSILDTVHEAGYFDQAHLTRSLKYLIGQTPAEIVPCNRQLSFFNKTGPPPRVYDAEHDGLGADREPH